MIDLDNNWIGFNCPVCGYADSVKFREVRLESTIWCHNCKKTIKLTDGNASVDATVKQVDRAMEELQKMFKKLK
jgi:transcription elongation factor Elf1